MTHLEKRAWTMLVTALICYVGYVVVVLGRVRSDGRSDLALSDVAYAAPLLWSIGLAVVANVVAEVVWSSLPGASRATDVRDAEIGRFGDQVGQAFVVIGSVAALLLALAEQPAFWIANAIYLGFVLSTVVGSLAKAAGYQQGLPW